MKTSTWIKIIGILCIVFGSLGIIGNIFTIISPMKSVIPEIGSSEISPGLLIWVSRLPYLALLCSTIYLFAGIIFLLKNPFSLKLMYFALSFSIFCSIVPMLLISWLSPNSFPSYEINIFNLRGPFIDVAVLIGVLRLSGYYFKSGEELKELLGEKRKTLTPKLLKILTFTGLFCTAVTISIFSLWGYAFNSGNNQADRVAIFTSYFPSFLRGVNDITCLSIVFCITAITLSGIGLTISIKIWKWLNIFILVLSILMLLMNLFSLM